MPDPTPMTREEVEALAASHDDSAVVQRDLGNDSTAEWHRATAVALRQLADDLVDADKKLKDGWIRVTQSGLAECHAELAALTERLELERQNDVIREEHDKMIRAELAALREERDQLQAAINIDGSLTMHEEFVDIAKDGAHALNKLGEIIGDLDRVSQEAKHLREERERYDWLKAHPALLIFGAHDLTNWRSANDIDSWIDAARLAEAKMEEGK